MNQSVFVSWSGGKDSCLALYRAITLGKSPELLITMMIESGVRSRSHGLSEAVLTAQARALGIPIQMHATSWNEYETVFRKAIQSARLSGGIFGDIDLQDHRDWVERVCQLENVEPHLPLWFEERKTLLKEFLESGFRAEIVAVKDGVLAPSFLGRTLDNEMLKEFENLGIDLCGEKGEYHTLVTDGPIFKHPLTVQHTSQLFKDGYWFSDVAIAPNEAPRET